MLASFSSFLPANLNLNILRDDRDREPRPEQSSPTTTSPAPAPRQPDLDSDMRPPQRVGTLAEEPAQRKKKEKSLNETFIVVRPPPAVSNHPLNLQLQLVPPHQREKTVASVRHSVDFGSNPLEGIPQSQSPTSINSPLERTISNRSNRSDVSMFSSVSSTSLSSTSTNGSARRMIVPLYNLCAHNVMTNTIVDAGTDAKVVKFNKRGMEVIGLAVLEPIEVYPGGGNEIRRKGSATSMSVRRSSLLVPPDGHTPDSSVISLTSTNETSVSPAMPPIPETPSTPTGAKRLFGKIFKRKDVPTRPFVLTPSASPNTSPATPRLTATLPVPQSPHARVSSESAQPILQPPVLGIQPTLISPSHPPVGRPHKYIWVVTKWLKTAPDNSLGGMMGRLTVDRAVPRDPASEVDVRIEWTRSRKRTVPRKRDSLVGTKPASSVHSSPSGGNKRASLVSTDRQPSIDSRHRSRSPKGGETTSEEASDDGRVRRNRQSRDDESADESDPEASETPWTCTLMVTSRNAAFALARSRSSRSSGSIGQPELTVTAASPDGSRSPALPSSGAAVGAPIRLKIATLSPAPYHPKVTAQLKVPFPLPDIEVDRVQVRKRVITAAGIARPATVDKPLNMGRILTAEEIKDILSSTALWLVVRESFGGVGKVNRKGDGWRIRG